MAELTTESCCSPAAQETCCEPEAKHECCGPDHESGTCGCSPGAKSVPDDQDELRAAVRERYGAAATAAGDQAEAGCCGGAGVITDEQRAVFGSGLYDSEQRDALPDAAQLASLGCGNPTAVAELHEGEAVLDLGSGGGIDVLLSARRVASSMSGSATTSDTAKRPPGRRTLAASRNTAGLSPERLITQLLMITSTESSESGTSSIVPFRNSTLSTPASRWLRRASSSISSVMSRP